MKNSISDIEAILNDEAQKKDDSQDELVIEEYDPNLLNNEVQTESSDNLESNECSNSLEETPPLEELQEEIITEPNEKEELQEVHVVEEPVIEPVKTSQEILDELNRIKMVLGQHYQKIVGIINFHKTKDESISKLSATVKNYRDGQSKQIFKAIINPVIRFREDCKKSLSDISIYNLDLEKIKKYIKYIDMDYEELLSTIGIEEGDEDYEYHGKPLKQIIVETKPIVFDEANFDTTAPALPEVEITSVEELCNYIVKSEECLREAVLFNDAKDKVIKNYVSYAESIEADYSSSRLYPVLYQMVNLKKKISYLVEQKLGLINEENQEILYEELLLYVINQLEAILRACDVFVEKSASDELDSQKDQIVKVIKLKEDDPQRDILDRKIAERHTDCYILDGKVVYQSKVDVYKK